MNKKTIRAATAFGGLLISMGVTSVLFQNCSQNQFDDLGAGTLSSQSVSYESSEDYDLDSPYQSGASSTKVVVEDDIITPRLVFSASRNGPAQKVFVPGQTIYARAYGLSANKAKLALNVTQFNTLTCTGSNTCSTGNEGTYSKKVASGLTYNSANKTWNFTMKFSFDIARKVILRDLTSEALNIDNICALVAGSSWCTNVGQVENTLVVRSPQPRILATVEHQDDPNSDTFGSALTNLDYRNWGKYRYSANTRFLFTGVPAGAKVRYCSEFAGTNTCANKGNWVMGASPGGYVSLAQTYKIDLTAKETTYFCKNVRLNEPFNKTVNMYAEDMNSGVQAQATFVYGAPVEGCTPTSYNTNPGSGVPSFGPG